LTPRRRIRSSSRHVILVVAVVAAAGILAGVFGWITAVIGAAAVILGVAISRATRRRNTSAGGDEPLSAAAGREALSAELGRSRRYGRQFVLVSIDAATSASVPFTRSREPGMPQAITRTLQALVRETDHVWSEGDLAYILLAECDERRAQGFLDRARSLLAALPAVVQTRYVCFPDDGVTPGGLLESLRHAEGDEHAPVPGVTMAQQHARAASDQPKRPATRRRARARRRFRSRPRQAARSHN
jgi:hypothetical protein